MPRPLAAAIRHCHAAPPPLQMPLPMRIAAMLLLICRARLFHFRLLTVALLLKPPFADAHAAIDIRFSCRCHF
jgi:hypothetical protein